MHGGQQFKPERSFKTSDEVRDTSKSLARLSVALEISLSILNRTRHELKLLLGIISAVRIAGCEMSLNASKDIAEVLGIRAIRALDIAELERLPSFLHEVHQLVHLKKRHEWVH